MKHIFWIMSLCLWAQTGFSLNVATTFPPIFSLVSGVTMNVERPTMINRNQSDSHHDYQLRSSEMKTLSRADIIFWVGPAFETYMPKALETNAQKNVISIPLMEMTKDLKIVVPKNAKEGQVDAHIWMDPDNAILMVQKIADVMKEQDPNNASRYQKNANDFVGAIKALDQYKMAENKKTATVAALHDGYAYVFAYMGLKNTLVYNMDDDSLVGPKTLKEIKKEMTNKKTKCVVVSPLMNKNLSKAVLSDNQKQIYSEPIGWGYNAGPSMYVELLGRVMSNIQKCLDD